MFSKFLVPSLVAGLAIGSVALANDPAADAAAKQAQAQNNSAAAPVTDAQAPTTPPAPKGLPVPDMPIVKKTELEGGLIAEDMKIGEGYEIKPGDMVVAHYHGTLKDGGKKFDSSYERGEPVAFPLGGVIQGWQKGVPGMKIGGIRKLTIPAALGYGAQGAGGDIPPNSDLVFVIEMVGALQKEDVTVGTGETVGPRPIVVAAYTMTGADGKEIESYTKDKPFIWVPGEHQGISQGLEGMKVGGKRKLTIPAQLNVTAQGAPGAEKRPNNVPVTVEIEVLQVKNLVPPQH
jgi:FKBP-type peptidyl-prolyl cis-trans isomerase